MTPEQTAATVDNKLDVQQTLAQRLRNQREALSMSVEDVSQRLHLPPSIVQAMERGDFDRLGPAVFARGHIRSYLRILQLPEVLGSQLFNDEQLQPVLEQVPGRRPANRFAEKLAWGMSTVLVTSLVAANIWYWVARHQTEMPTLSGLDAPLSEPRDQNESESGSSASRVDGSFVGPPRWAAGTTLAPSSSPASPVVASMSPFSSASPVTTSSGSDANRAVEVSPQIPADPALEVSQVEVATAFDAAGEAVLRLKLSAESWVDIRDASGRRLEFSLLDEGVDRRYPLGSGLTVRLGNARAASLEVNGESVSIEPFINANVASFQLSDQGGLTSPAG